MNRRKRQHFPLIPPELPPAARDCFTDLALEQQTLLRREAGSAEIPGVSCRVRVRRGLRTTTVRITDPAGSAALGKPMGCYVTLEPDPKRMQTQQERERLARALAGELAQLMELAPETPVLAVGLGNDRVAYDALGPRVLEGLWITRHLQDSLPPALGPIRPVSALAPGVLGRTGVESGQLVRAVVEQQEIGAVLVFDALAARNRAALGAAIQLTDTGLCPGSGILAGRRALDRETLGVPVCALGVPMLSTLEESGDFLVIPREVERRTAWFGALIARSVNLALHPQLTEGQLAELLEQP